MKADTGGCVNGAANCGPNTAAMSQSTDASAARAIAHAGCSTDNSNVEPSGCRE